MGVSFLTALDVGLVTKIQRNSKGRPLRAASSETLRTYAITKYQNAVLTCDTVDHDSFAVWIC